MTTPFDTHRTECLDLLERQLGSLEAAREDALATVREADRLIKPLRRALTGFSEQPKPKTVRADKKSCSNKQEIGELIEKALVQNGQVPRVDLKDLVADALRGRGRNLSMFAKLFGECLKAPSLKVDENGVVSQVGTETGRSHASPTRQGD